MNSFFTLKALAETSIVAQGKLQAAVEAVTTGWTYLARACNESYDFAGDKWMKYSSILWQGTVGVLLDLAKYRPVVISQSVEITSLSAADYVVKSFIIPQIAAQVLVNNTSGLPAGVGIISVSTSSIIGAVYVTFYNATAAPVDATVVLTLTVFRDTGDAATVTEATSYVKGFYPEGSGKCDDFKL
jgi:hypothetical protein